MTTLTLTVTDESALIEGTVKGDAVHKSLTPRPWVWSRGQAGYVLPRSMTPLTRGYRVDEFKRAAAAAGVEVELIDEREGMSEAERREARESRLDVRADRLEGRAERLSGEAEARYAAEHSILDGIPVGQPILVGHHSERRHRRDLDRAESHRVHAREAEVEAQEAAGRAEGIRRHQSTGDATGTILRRIKANEASVRKMDRELKRHNALRAARVGNVYRLHYPAYEVLHGLVITLAELVSSYEVLVTAAGDFTGYGEVSMGTDGAPVTTISLDRIVIADCELVSDDSSPLEPSDYALRIESERARLVEAIELDRATMAEREANGVKVWSRDDFKKGDYVKFWGGTRKVVRVNAKSLSVESGYSWTDTLPYDKVAGRIAAEDVK